MASSLSIAAYLALLGDGDRQEAEGGLPPRPSGTVVWARCSNVRQITAIETLGRRLNDEGDDISILATLPTAIEGRAIAEPVGRRNVRAFIRHWQPAIVVWVYGELDPVMLNEMRAAQLPCFLVDAAAEGFDKIAGSWVPGMMRALLSQFDKILTLDRKTADLFVRAGIPPRDIRITGQMEDSEPPLSHNENERVDLAETIGTRPVWLAAGAHPNEISDLCDAHTQASRGAHRLLLVVVPHDIADGENIANQIAGEGFDVALRSDGEEIEDPTQVYIADTKEELGLWYRLAPISYLGGSLHGGKCRDPFEPATLGSAVLHGPHIAPWQNHALRLSSEGASQSLRSADELGSSVEALLSTEKTARMVHSAWDITTRGADVTDTIVGLIQASLDEMGR